MIAIHIEMSGDKEVQAAFVKLGNEVSELGWVFEKLGEPALKDIQQRFEVAGPGWEPHAESTRKKIIGPLRILRDTDTLYNSFAKDGDNNVWRINSLEAEFGSSVFYGVFHQEGRGHNPVRTIIDATDDQQARYAKIAGEQLKERIQQIGFEVV